MRRVPINHDGLGGMANETVRSIRQRAGEVRALLTRQRSVGARDRISILVLIMMGVSLVTGVTALCLLYWTAFAQQKMRLVEMAQSRSQLIQAIGRFDAIHSQEDHPDGARAATLSQIVDAHKYFRGFGKTGEFVLGQREGDRIVFLLSHRHFDLENPNPIPFSSTWAEPMRRALSEQSGTVTALDYRGEMVLAAHEPVTGLEWGIVAKIDLAEIRAPFVQAGILSACIALLCIVVGTRLFLRVSNPLIVKLEEDEARIRAVVETAADGIVTTDKGGIVESVNNAAEVLFGYEAEALIGQNVSALIPASYQEEHADGFARYLRTGEAKILGRGREVEGLRKDGTIFPMDLAVSEVRLAGGVAFTGIMRDLTERKRGEEERVRLATAVESAGDTILITDAAGTIQFVNPAFTKITGYTRADALGQNPRILKSGRQDAAFYRALWATLLRGEVWRGFLVNRRKDGTLFDAQLTIAAVRDASGTTINYVSVGRDVTEQKKAERELAETTRELADRNSELDSFVFSVSHDLKTPLVTLQGYTMALEQDCADVLSGDAKRYLLYVREATAKIGTLIQDLLQLSRVERLEELRTEVDVEALVHEVIKEYKVPIDERGVMVTVHSGFPTVVADRARLREVFDNLVSNAVKFLGSVREPRIEVGYAQGVGEHQFLVRDNGIGIEPDYHDRIFGVFYRLKEVEDPQGTGVGLAIVQRIVDRHGGRIWIESRHGHGSTFRFTLPADEPGEHRITHIA